MRASAEQHKRDVSLPTATLGVDPRDLLAAFGQQRRAAIGDLEVGNQLGEAFSERVGLDNLGKRRVPAVGDDRGGDRVAQRGDVDMADVEQVDKGL